MFGFDLEEMESESGTTRVDWWICDRGLCVTCFVCVGLFESKHQS